MGCAVLYSLCSLRYWLFHPPAAPVAAIYILCINASATGLGLRAQRSAVARERTQALPAPFVRHHPAFL
jgi:hypothetical protein